MACKGSGVRIPLPPPLVPYSNPWLQIFLSQDQGRVLSSTNGVEAWRKMVITAAEHTKAVGGCPLGSLGGQLAESDAEARALIAAGFEKWVAVIGDALGSLHADGKLPPDIDSNDLAITLLATLQGGLLLAQVQRSIRPFEIAVNTVLDLAVSR